MKTILNTNKHHNSALLFLLLFAAIHMASAQIQLESTVLVDPTPGNPTNDICGTADSLIVAPGTPIQFCFKVFNNDSSDYTLHSLYSSEFGHPLVNFPFTLVPAASVFLIERKDIFSTTVVESTWTSQKPSLTPGYTVNTIAYSFTDISATGTALNIADDGEVDVFLGFNFLMGGIYSGIATVGNNGAIRFGVHGGQVAANIELPNEVSENIIAPFWDDLDDVSGNVYSQTMGVAPNRIFIVQWQDRPHFPNIGAATFQSILYETTNLIQFNYQDTDFGSVNFDGGASATVGISGSSNAAQYLYNTASIPSLSSLTFTHPDKLNYAVKNNGDDEFVRYNFVNIATIGTALNLGDDSEVTVTLDFPFYLSHFSSNLVTIGNNGAIRLGTVDAEILAPNTLLSNDMASNIIAPFWDDLHNATGNVYHYTSGVAPNRIFIVQWDRPHYLASGYTAGEISVQAKLFETTNKIEFHYKDVTFDDNNFDFGLGATVGISGSTTAEQFSYDSADLTDEMAISFAPLSSFSESSDTTTIIVTGPDIDVDHLTFNLSIEPNVSNTFVDFSFDNLGMAVLNWTIDDCGTSSSWMTLPNTTSGSLNAGQTVATSFNVDTTGLALGSYTGDLCIDSNDPDEATKIINVNLNVAVIFMNGFES